MCKHFRLFLPVLFNLYFSPLRTFSHQINDSLPVDHAVRIGILPNGLTYYIKELDSEGINLGLVVKAGYLDERPDQFHLAHVLEHVVFEKTKHKLIDQGLVLGRDMNASTGYRNTTYYTKLPNARAEMLDSALVWLKMATGNQKFSSADINSSRGPVLNEISGGNSKKKSENFLQKILYDVNPAFLKGAETQRAVEHVKSFEDSSLLSFYERWYRPQNESIFITGNINAKEIEKKLSLLFGTPDINPPFIDQRNRKNQLGKQRSFVTVTESDGILKIKRFIKTESFDLKSKADFRRWIAIQLFNSMTSARFNDLVLNNPGIVEVSSHLFNWKMPFSFPDMNIDAWVSDLVVHLSPGDARIKQLIDAFFRLEKQIMTHGFSEAELETAKKKLQIQISNEAIKGMTLSGMFFKLMQHYIDGSAVLKPEKELELKTDLIKDVSVNEINTEFAFKNKLEQPVWFSDAQHESLKKTVMQSFNTIRKGSVSAYEFKPKEPQFVADRIIKQSPNVDDVTIDSVAGRGIYEIKHPNGCRMLFKYLDVAGKNGKPLVFDAIYNNSPGSFDTNFVYQRRAMEVVGNSRVAGLTSTEYKKFLVDNNIEFYTPGFVSAVSGAEPRFGGESSLEHLETLFKLGFEFIQNPQFDKSVIKKIETDYRQYTPDKASFMAELENRYSVWNTANAAALIKSVDIGKLKMNYNHVVSNISNLTLIVTGPAKLDTLVKYFSTYFGYLDSLPGKTPVLKVSIEPKDGTDAYLSIKKTSGGQRFQFSFYSRYNYSMIDQVRLSLLRLIVYNRVISEIREKMGAIYTASVKARRKGINLAYFSISGEVRSGNLDSVVSVIKNEISELKTEGPSDEELKLTVSQFLSGIDATHRSADFWFGYFLNQMVNNADLSQVVNVPDIASRTTADEIKAVANSMFSFDSFSKVIE